MIRQVKITAFVLILVILCSCRTNDQARTEDPIVLRERAQAKAVHASDMRRDIYEHDYAMNKIKAELQRLRTRVNDLGQEIKELESNVEKWQAKKQALPRREAYRKRHTVKRWENHLDTARSQHQTYSEQASAMELQIRELQIAQATRIAEAGNLELQAYRTNRMAAEQEEKPRREKEVWDIW